MTFGLESLDVLASPPSFADDLAAAVLAGEELSREAGLRILRTPDDALPSLLRAAFRVRERFFGRRVKLCLLRNARSGLCPEDCGYCSQSRVSKASVPVYALEDEATLAAGADRAVAAGARRYCMVLSGRRPSDADVERLSAAARRIKAKHPALELCVSPGLLNEAQARALREAGVGWINHNLNTSERFHPAICTTHTYADRLRTVEAARRAGLRICCGGIVGMGETDADLVDLALALAGLGVDSLPVNFLHPIPGTPLGGRRDLTPARCLKALSLFRLANPRADVRVAGGRELNLGPYQSLALYPATSLFVEGYLTTPGQMSAEARRWIEQAGFQVEQEAA